MYSCTGRCDDRCTLHITGLFEIRDTHRRAAWFVSEEKEEAGFCCTFDTQ